MAVLVARKCERPSVVGLILGLASEIKNTNVKIIMRRLNENDKSSVCLKLLLLLANRHRFSSIKMTHAYTYTFSIIIISHFDMNDNTSLTKRFQNRFEPYALLTRLIDIKGRLRDFHWPPIHLALCSIGAMHVCAFLFYFQ